MAQQEISLTTLENSKVFISPKSDTFTFKHPMDYFSPFLDKFQQIEGVQINIIVDDHVANSERDEELLEGNKNIAYGSVMAKVKLPDDYLINVPIENPFNKLTGEIGLVYNLTTLKPEIRLYKGKRVSICSNGVIFGATNVASYSLTNNSYRELYENTTRYIDNSLKDMVLYADTIEKMHNTVLDKYAIQQTLGELLIFAKKQKELGINAVSDAVTYLITPSSRYAIKADNTATMWNIYNSVTESLKKSTILTEATKISLLQEVFLKNDFKKLG